jgi:hypothetical protein
MDYARFACSVQYQVAIFVELLEVKVAMGIDYPSYEFVGRLDSSR